MKLVADFLIFTGFPFFYKEFRKVKFNGGNFDRKFSVLRIDGDMVPLGLGGPSFARCQLALFNCAGRTARRSWDSNPLPLGYKPRMLSLDHAGDIPPKYLFSFTFKFNRYVTVFIDSMNVIMKKERSDT